MTERFKLVGMKRARHSSRGWEKWAGGFVGVAFGVGCTCLAFFWLTREELCGSVPLAERVGVDIRSVDVGDRG